MKLNGIDFSVDEDLFVRITNVAPEDDITISALNLGNVITELLRMIADDMAEDDDDGPPNYEFWKPE